MCQVEASIIIPTYNKLSRLKLVLKSLEKQITLSTEVIIVFDGCMPEVVEAFQKLTFSFKPIQIICSSNIGRACARNRGILASKGKIIFFLDDDRLVEKNYVKTHLEAHHERCVVLGIRKEIYIVDDQIDNFFENTNQLETYLQGNSYLENCFKFNKAPYHPLRWLNFFTGNVSIEREDLIKVGQFDEGFKGWGQEDIDLGIRLANEKIKFIRCEDAINYHMTHASNYLDKRKDSILNFKYMIKKYKSKFFVVCILSGLLFKQILVGTQIPKKLKKQYEQYE